ncbi:MAG: ferritin-like domain-containing protein [Aliihoeflea sp.]
MQGDPDVERGTKHPDCTDDEGNGQAVLDQRQLAVGKRHGVEHEGNCQYRDPEPDRAARAPQDSRPERVALGQNASAAPALDAGLLAAAQAVEHYEIARYGTLRRWAQALELPEAVKLLEETLKEESKTDESLTKLADTQVNDHAKQAA